MTNYSCKKFPYYLKLIATIHLLQMDRETTVRRTTTMQQARPLLKYGRLSKQKYYVA